MESLLKLKAQKLPEYKERQLASIVKFTALRNFTIVDVTPKEGLFKKLFKQENVKEYKLRILNEEEDLVEGSWPYPLALDMLYTEPLEEDDKEWFESFPDPAWCYTKLNEAAELEERAAAHSKEMLEAIHWLKEQWGNGYKIYADVGDLFDYYGPD